MYSFKCFDVRIDKAGRIFYKRKLWNIILELLSYLFIVFFVLNVYDQILSEGVFVVILTGFTVLVLAYKMVRTLIKLINGDEIIFDPVADNVIRNGRELCNISSTREISLIRNQSGNSTSSHDLFLNGRYGTIKLIRVHIYGQDLIELSKLLGKQLNINTANNID